MKRLNLFVKGNVDVHDSLHSCRIGGELLWNGLGEVLRTDYPHVTARIRHETWARSDAQLEASGQPPQSVADRDLPLGPYTPAIQFSRRLFDAPSDAIVLAIQPDITSGMVRHKTEGYLFYPNDSGTWSEEDRLWLKRDFGPPDHLTPEASMANLAALVEKIRETSEAPILIYNMSPIIPGENIHCYMGLGETYSARIRKFNVGLVDLSEQTGISIVDVDSILARHGADSLKLDAIHLTPRGYELIAREVVRILADLGVLEES